MCVQRRLLGEKRSCWLANICIMLLTGGPVCQDFWNQWWSGGMFDTCSYQVGDEYISLRKPCIYVLKEDMEDCFIKSWVDVVQRNEATIDGGNNKLRTYSKFKKDFKCEQYLLSISNAHKRNLLFKFRVGVAPLRIDTGRWEANIDPLTGVRRKGIREECRMCMCCFGGVEDEQHFLLLCPVYSMVRSRFMRVVRMYWNENNINIPNESTVLFTMIMTCMDNTVICALGDFVWNAFKLRAKVLGI